MSRSALVLCLLAAVWGAAHPSRLRGLTRELGDGRIVGGETVDISQFPWQISLGFMLLGKFRHFCGGSIIGSTWVLTAAHCLQLRTSQKLYVRAGSSFHSTGGTVYGVAKIIPHEDYSCFTGDYDFALLEISEPIAFGSNVQAVNLGSSEIDGGTKVNITGWGITSPAGGQPEQLQLLTTTVVDRDTCSEAYAHLNTVTQSMMCAGEMEGGKGACHGDSGGALVAGNTQYGVASWTVGCFLPGLPGVYSNVPAVRSWITEKTGI